MNPRGIRITSHIGQSIWLVSPLRPGLCLVPVALDWKCARRCQGGERSHAAHRAGILGRFEGRPLRGCAQADSGDRRNTIRRIEGSKSLDRGLPLEDFSGSVVEFVLNCGEVIWGVDAEV